MTPLLTLNVVGDRLNSFQVRHAIIGAGVGHKAAFNVGFGWLAAIPFDGRYDRANGQIVLFGEGEVAAVVGWNAHDCPGAVGGQHIVGGKHWYPLTVQTIGGVSPQKHAGLFLFGG